MTWDRRQYTSPWRESFLLIPAVDSITGASIVGLVMKRRVNNGPTEYRAIPVEEAKST